MSNRKISNIAPAPHSYGWVPDLPDRRDHIYAAPARVLAALPPSVDLRQHCPPVYDQGALGSCTAQAIGAAHEFNQRRQGDPMSFTPSRLFIYYNERVAIGTVNEDSGAMIRDGIKSLAKQGAPPEKLWPYRISRFTKKPTPTAYAEAEKHQSLEYSRLSGTLNDLRACLAEGFPFVFGFTVYESFESAVVARTGIMPMPGRNERSLGGHAVLAVGYDTVKSRFIVRNSWSDGWGDKGYFYMPFNFMTNRNLTDDFWKITRIEDI